MPTEPDPWTSGGEATRAEVREIFARHSDQAAAERAAEEERRSPLPSFLLVPARVWQVLPTGGRIVVGAVLLAVVALAAILVPPALRTASENRAEVRRAEAANLESIRRELVESQRPRRAVLPVPLRTEDLNAAVAADFERRVRAGQLEGPAGPTSCRLIRPQREREAAAFTCLAERGAERGVYGDRELVSGYRFRARVERATGAAAWCKESPRPLHADQEEFVVVPLSRACTG